MHQHCALPIRTDGSWHEADERFLAVQQIIHGTGFVGTFPFLEMGLPQVLVDTFEAGRVLDAIKRHGVTTTVLVPPMMAGWSTSPSSGRGRRLA